MYVGRTTTARWLIFIAAFIVFTSPASPQTKDQGQENFLSNCAQCHGKDAKGNGLRSGELRTKPPDLTLLARKNKGIFNADAIYELIDGRKAVSGSHLSADMPIWGCRHQSLPPVKRRVPKHYRPSPLVSPPVVERRDSGSTLQSLLDLSCDSDETIRGRILSIVEYLSRIQVP